MISNAFMLNQCWRLANQAGMRRFAASLANPGDVQRRHLLELVRRNRQSAFGQRCNFSHITAAEDYRTSVPLQTWSDIAPWVERIRGGETAVLTTDPVTRLVPTGGSSGGAKLIPWTRGLGREFSAAIAPWMGDLHARYPEIRHGPAYWSISPLAEIQDDSAIPIGFDDDSAYLGAALSGLVRPLFAAPSALRFITDVETFRYATLRCLLARQELRLISVWHPSFLHLLLDASLQHRNELLNDLANGGMSRTLPAAVKRAIEPWMKPAPRRAAALEQVDWNDIRNLWPHLAVVSCWEDGAAALPAAALQRRIGTVPLQPKGLLATEAAISIPWRGRYVAIPTGSVFEFITPAGASRWIDELETGQTYEVAVTNAGGLWRYRLGDQVRVDSFIDRTPCLSFLGRSGVVSDLVGEKLEESFVAQCFSKVLTSASFALLAPNGDGSDGYTVFSDIPLGPTECSCLDAHLATNPTWKSARRLGQLAPLRSQLVGTHASAVWLTHRRGTCLGAIKPAVLDADRSWSARFAEHIP